MPSCFTQVPVLQDFTLDMYFRQFWQDPRLSFSEPGLEKLVVGAEYIKLIWVPDTFFVNEKTAYFHDATTENQFLRILHTGEILRSIRWVVPKYIQERQFIWHCRSGYNSTLSISLSNSLTHTLGAKGRTHRNRNNLKTWSNLLLLIY